MNRTYITARRKLLAASVLAVCLAPAIARGAPFLSGGFSDPPGSNGLSNINLTNPGQEDWRFWNTSSLSPTDEKLGGSAISDLSAIGSPTLGTTPSCCDHTFDWTDGTNTPVAAGQQDVLSTTGIGGGISFTVSASRDTRRLRIYNGFNVADHRLTATLSDGSAAPLVIDYGTGVGSEADNLDYYIFTIDFAAASADQTLTIGIVQQGGNTSGHPQRFQAVAVAITEIAGPIPEPSSAGMWGAFALVGLVAKRARFRRPRRS